MSEIETTRIFLMRAKTRLFELQRMLDLTAVESQELYFKESVIKTYEKRIKELKDTSNG